MPLFSRLVIKCRDSGQLSDICVTAMCVVIYLSYKKYVAVNGFSIIVCFRIFFFVILLIVFLKIMINDELGLN